MTKKIFQAVLVAAMAVLLVSIVVIMGCMYVYSGDLQRGQLKSQLRMAVVGVEQDGETYLASLRGESFRLTWVSADGTVLYDTQMEDVSAMENHAGRDEIHQALTTGEGESTRYSSTLMEKMLYHAVMLSDGTVLRIAVNTGSAVLVVLGLLQPIAITALLAVVLSAVLAGRMAKRIVKPLNRIDLDHPLEGEPYEELSPMLSRIQQQHTQIETQMRELRRKTDEFDQITRSMREGLLLLDRDGVMLSINPAARRIFAATDVPTGQDFLTVDRGSDLRAALHGAQEDGHRELRIERSGRVYQLDISRIDCDGASVGLVLLAFDVTEQSFSERNRREFTANVSHELKTPLQSIMGSAELIENGLVKPEDMPRFIHQIRHESARLLALIQDIIRLSQLDEEQEETMEAVDALAVAQECITSLRSAASGKEVTLALTGSPVQIWGVERLLHEIVFNLCDNAIKYNVTGGRVDVDVSTRDRSAVITVRDTGVGIPAAHQSRIFERFYRVDKSHSRASGGTGLGLSIVKHAVQYLHGTVTVDSREGEGSCFTVRLPRHE